MPSWKIVPQELNQFGDISQVWIKVYGHTWEDKDGEKHWSPVGKQIKLNLDNVDPDHDPIYIRWGGKSASWKVQYPSVEVPKQVKGFKDRRGETVKDVLHPGIVRKQGPVESFPTKELMLVYVEKRFGKVITEFMRKLLETEE